MDRHTRSASRPNHPLLPSLPLPHTHPPQPTTTTTTTKGSTRLTRALNFFVLLAVDMSLHVDGACGAAMRRRQRRLCAQWRHEQQTVAMVATAGHHSFGPTASAAPRDQTTGTSAVEEVVNSTHDAPRGQNTPPPGVRLCILAEPGPQRSDRSRRHPSGDGMPTLALPSLAGSAGEAVDGVALAFLTSRALAAQEEYLRRKPGVGLFPAGQPSRRGQCTGTDPF